MVLRRWREQGQSHAELVVGGLPTDRDRNELRGTLLVLRASVLRQLIEDGMRVWSTERRHDDDQQAQMIVDRLKPSSQLDPEQESRPES